MPTSALWDTGKWDDSLWDNTETWTGITKSELSMAEIEMKLESLERKMKIEAVPE